MARPNRKSVPATQTPAQVPPVDPSPSSITIDAAVLAVVVEGTNGPSGMAYIDPAQASVLAAQGLIVVNTTLLDEAGNIASRANFPAAAAYLASLDAADAPASDAATAWSQQSTPQPGASAATSPAPALVNGFAIDDDVVAPKVKRDMSNSVPKYPFDALQVGQSFHVPMTAELPDPKRTLATTVSVTNLKHSYPLKDETGAVIMEDQSYNETQRDPKTGEPLKDSAGEIIIKRIEKTGPQLGYHKKFRVFRVDKTDKRGEGARVLRIV